MTFLDKFLSAKYTIGFILLVLLATWFPFSSVLNIGPELADYWISSKYLNWGFLENPPLFPAFLYIISILGLDAAVMLKTIIIVLSSILIFLSYLAANLMFDRRTAIVFTLLIVTTPYFTLGVVYWNPDKFSYLFWMLSFISLAKLIRSGSQNWCFLLGFSIGLGILTQYSMVQVLVVLIIWVSLTASARKKFFNWKFPVSIVLMLGIVAPNIVWNYQNNWLSFLNLYDQFVSGIRISPLFVWFLVILSIGFSLVLLVYFLWQLIAGNLKREEIGDESDQTKEIWSLLKVTIAVNVSVSIIVNLFGDEIRIELLTITFFCLFLLLARFISQEINHGLISRQVTVFAASILTTILFAGLVMYLQQSLYNPVKFPDKYSLNRFIGWNEIASKVEEVCEQNDMMTIDYVISSEYELSSALGLYIEDKPNPYSLVNSDRNIWSPVRVVRSSHTVLVCRFDRCRDVTLAASAHFESTFELLGDASVQRAGKVIHELKVFKLIPNNI